MKIFALVLACLVSVPVFAAEEKIKMYYNQEELSKIIEAYSKASGQKFVIDPSMRGRVSILVQEPVTLDEAFNHLSSALAINGYGISKQGDTMVIQSARNIQRNLLEVTTDLPKLTPQRMATWVYNFKYVSAENVNRDMRVLVSKDGEMSVFPDRNQMIISDWTSNLQRVADIITQVDTPAAAAAAAKYKKEAKKTQPASPEKKER